MHPALLLLADSRLPAGGHAHSGGVEAAVAAGAVLDVATLAAFLRGRLHTTGAVCAALAAAACALPTAPSSPVPTSPDVLTSSGRVWEELDAEADARTASPAQRRAARQQGRLLLRVAGRLWPSPVLESLAAAVPSPHHPVALGAAAHAAGAAPEDAALAAAYHAITGPATAAVRLLGLDPVAVHRLLADLTPNLTTVTARAAEAAARELQAPVGGQAAVRVGERAVRQGPPEDVGGADPDLRTWAGLPAYSAPALDLLAERHAEAAVRLFVS
ncbi:urease accessory protein UreF [Nonomuraea longicatena]|uniref:Urease accessory protein UreF n=1 Tax=Nonomuraea longicatena TaxID=83682 RepID=A0ABP3ZZA5_9ACTN